MSEDPLEREWNKLYAMAVEHLGPCGRLIGLSKLRYLEAHPDRDPVFNANLCTEDEGKIWYGDIDLALDMTTLEDLARATGKTLYVLPEMSGRFANEQRPVLGDARAVITGKPADQ